MRTTAGAGTTRRSERVRLKGLLLALALLFACNKPPAQAPSAPRKNEPAIHATVVTIQTTIQPANKTYTHTLVIAGNRARSSDEADQWRLFDFAQKRVTFVDDVARTFHIEPFANVI